MARAGSLSYELFTLAWLQKKPRRNLSSFQINDLQGRWLHRPPGNTTSILPKFRSPSPSVSSWYYRKRGPFFLQSGSRPSGYLSGIECVLEYDLQYIGFRCTAKWFRYIYIERERECARVRAHACDMLAKLLQSRPTLWDPMDCCLPASSVHGILQARILKWAAIGARQFLLQQNFLTQALNLQLLHCRQML